MIGYPITKELVTTIARVSEGTWPRLYKKITFSGYLQKRAIFSLKTYFLRLFFWLAAIFSLAVSGAAFTETAFPSAPAEGVSGLLSTFLPLPFLFPSSLMKEHYDPAE